MCPRPCVPVPIDPPDEPDENHIDTPDLVEEADKESFPASDAPARTVVTRTLVRRLEPGELD